MLTVSGKALGRRQPLFADFSVPPPDDVAAGGNSTLRDLIEAVVRHEVAAFKERQAGRQFIRALTATEITEAEERGRIDSGGSQVGAQVVDADEAVDTALQAFADGIYLVVVDEVEQRDLDARVNVTEDTRVTFIRLTLLAGG